MLCPHVIALQAEMDLIVGISNCPSNSFPLPVLPTHVFSLISWESIGDASLTVSRNAEWFDPFRSLVPVEATGRFEVMLR